MCVFFLVGEGVAFYAFFAHAQPDQGSNADLQVDRLYEYVPFAISTRRLRYDYEVHVTICI